ncbi:enoyl-CoA hydratase/isomerase family protein, partial [Planctomycetaceae bacterium AH-315-I19]|nr:enoyl-CoA hydratase/isomerase family protein [Planctomycetaceae bacterium AH-315-I19]
MIRTNTNDGVAEISLDRADKRNAMTPEMADAFVRAIESANENNAARAILVRGEGDAFCAGFDLKMCYETDGTLEALLRGLSEAVRSMRRCSKPVILAAHGAAIAGGCAMLGGADYVVTERNAKLGYPVVSLGISPAVSAPTLVRSTGAGNARERLLEPRVFGGEEALRIGLAHECVADAHECAGRSRELAYRFASKPTGAMQATKRWLNEVDSTDR